jgi:hypothetical protein
MKVIYTLILLIAFSLFALPLFRLAFGYYTHVTVTDKVLKTERVMNPEGAGSKYLIFGAHETYENMDSFLNWKFNSSDVYGAILPGQTCTFVVYGWRIPFFSWYRNLVSAKCK